MNYKITIRNGGAIIVYEVIVTAENETNAVIKALKENNIELYDCDTIQVETI